MPAASRPDPFGTAPPAPKVPPIPRSYRKFSVGTYVRAVQKAGGMRLLGKFFQKFLPASELATCDALDPEAVIKFLTRRSKMSLLACSYLSFAHDLATIQGKQFLRKTALSSTDPAILGLDLHQRPELLSLSAFTEFPTEFIAAHDRLGLARSSPTFRLFAGKRLITIEDPAALARKFQEKLSALKTSNKVVVRAFKENAMVGFVFYYEKSQKKTLVMDTKLTMSHLVHRPLNEDFICFNQDSGHIETEIGIEEDREPIRKAFAEACTDDPNFFDGPGSTDFLALDHLLDTEFSPNRDTVSLTRIVFEMNQEEAPRFEIKSKNVIETMITNELRETHPGLAEISSDHDATGVGRRTGPCFRGSTVVDASLEIAVPDCQKRIHVELKPPNLIAFHRSVYNAAVFNRLRALGLLKK